MVKHLLSLITLHRTSMASPSSPLLIMRGRSANYRTNNKSLLSLYRVLFFQLIAAVAFASCPAYNCCISWVSRGYYITIKIDVILDTTDNLFSLTSQSSIKHIISTTMVSCSTQSSKLDRKKKNDLNGRGRGQFIMSQATIQNYVN